MSNWLVESLIRFIARCIPKRGKRIIYVTLCYVLWSHQNDTRKMYSELKEINTKLHLADDVRSFSFVLEIYDLLLHSQELKPMLTAGYQNLVAKTPRWLRYGDTEEMRQDLKVVFNPIYYHGDNLQQPAVV